MTENKNPTQRRFEFSKALAKMIHEKTGAPVFALDPEIVESVYKIVKSDPGFAGKLDDQELREEISGFVSTWIFDKPKSNTELRERVGKFVEGLEREKTYEASLLLRELIGLPIGLKLGPLEIVDEIKDKKELLEHLERLKEDHLIFTEGRTWGRVSFKTYRTQRVQEKFRETLELPFGILALVTGISIDVANACGAIYSQSGRIYMLSPKNQPLAWTRYSETAHRSYFDKFGAILGTKRRSKLEEKIVNSIRIYWLSRISERSEIKFLMTMAALESLLLSKNDRDYIGMKLSEKTAFLLENEREGRISLYTKMKGYYSQRSDLVHIGKSDIKETDATMLQSIYRALVFKLLELGQQYKKMDQKSHDEDEEGIEDYINKLKFS